MKISHAVQKIQRVASMAKFKDEQAKKEHFDAYSKAKTKEQKIILCMKGVVQNQYTGSRLLEERYLHLVVVRRLGVTRHNLAEGRRRLRVAHLRHEDLLRELLQEAQEVQPIGVWRLRVAQIVPVTDNASAPVPFLIVQHAKLAATAGQAFR